MQKKLYLKASISLLLLLSSCALKPPNVPICVELAPDRGACIKIISGEKFEINEQSKYEGMTWWESRPTMLQMPASSWSQIKSFIIKNCKKSNQCEKEVTNWEKSIEIIDSQIDQKLP